MYFNEGRSIIICVPDFRDTNGVAELFENELSEANLLVQDSNDVGSKRYEVFLTQLEEKPRILLGSRSVMYSPLPEDSALIIWDDGDPSHQDQQSPYLTTRELALIRQSQFAGPIHFLSHSRSTEIQRLIEIGYLQESSHSSWRPKVSISEGKGLDGASFKAIKKGLESGPVLFQVAAPGQARSLYCSGCNQRSACNACNGPLWLNAQGKTVCRWCGNFNLHFLCKECGNAKLVQGAAGATRWVEQLGKSFPGIPIREVTVSQGIQEVSDKAQIVVSTPGIEPVAKRGYSAVVLIDCLAQLSRDTLRAPEDALRVWLNALSLMRSSGEAVAVGVSSEVSRALTLGEVTETASKLLGEREELGFPPAKRLMSAVGSRDLLTDLGEKLSTISGSKILGIAAAQSAASGESFRLLVSFSYASGNQVANVAREFLAGLTTKAVRTNSRSGKSIRPVTIKFDDPSVL
jgi:primosomal protein N' (replication factor Y)